MPFFFFFFLLRLVLLEETNNTQAPGQDTRRAPHSGRERSTHGTGTETGVGVGVGRVVSPGVAAGGAGVLPRKRCDWTGRRRKLADCGRPLTRGRASAYANACMNSSAELQNTELQPCQVLFTVLNYYDYTTEPPSIGASLLACLDGRKRTQANAGKAYSL